MNWKFWKRKQAEQEASQLTDLQAEMKNARTDMQQLSDQMKKMTRMQMKSTKQTEEKIDHLESVVSAQNKERELYDIQKNREETIKGNVIRLLDELDHVLSGINEADQSWNALLNQWSTLMVHSLEALDVYQLEVMGETFNPEVAEAIQTVPKDALPFSPEVAYQVITVINRGFVTGKGALIRKAKVVTIKEDDSNGQG